MAFWQIHDWSKFRQALSIASCAFYMDTFTIG
jgi:hypothetical protein